MKKIKRNDFAKAVVETHILEKSMLTSGSLENFLKDKGSQNIYLELVGKGYFKNTDIILSKSNFDILLRKSLEDFADEIYNISPDKTFLDLLFLEFDIFNIKTLLMNTDSNSGYYSDLIQIPKHRAKHFLDLSESTVFHTSSFYDVLYLKSAEIYHRDGSKKLQEFLDCEYFEYLLYVAECSGVELFVKYAKAKIDFYNILLYFRVIHLAELHPDIESNISTKVISNLLIRGGTISLEEIELLNGKKMNYVIDFIDSTTYRYYLVDGIKAYSFDKDLSVLEKYMDDYITDLCKSKQYTPLGAEPIFGYFHGRKIEIINLRLILTCQFLGVPEHTVRERMRDSYV